MSAYEYKVVPAPTKGLKAPGIKGAEARFSHAIQELMNGLAGEGWEYQRAETLPSLERSGLTGSTTEWRNVLVFRRPRENDAAAFTPELLPAPETPTQAPKVPVEARAAAPVQARRKPAPQPPAPTAKTTPAEPPLVAKPKEEPASSADDTSGIASTLKKFATTRRIEITDD